MIKTIKSILFATDLSEKSSSAFYFAVSLGTIYQATIILLHVTEKIPDYAKKRLREWLGKEEYQKIVEEHENSIHQTLTAKKSSNSFIKTALEQFCTKAGIDDNACGYHSREIVISQGDVVDEIINQSKHYTCDLVILGGHKGFLGKTAIGSVVKDVLRRSEIPVMVVPPVKQGVLNNN